MIRAVVGIDIGTTHTKGVLATEEGLLMAQASREATLHSPRPTWAEEDADEWWQNTVEILRELTAAARGRADIAAVGVSGMVPTLILLDADGRPLRRSIQQNDARAAREIGELEEEFGQEEFFRLTGGSINQQVLAPKLRWLARHERDVLARTSRICGSYDFIAALLTGELHAEHNWALESGLVDIEDNAWSERLVALAGISQELLPEIRPSHEVVGTVSNEASDLTGVPAGTPVISGVADHVASAFAATATDPGDLLVKFGGAGDILYSLDRLVTDSRLFIDHHVVPDNYYLNGCMATSGSLVKWFATNFCHEDAAAAEAANENIYARLDRQAEHVPPGADGLVLLPYFLGEKTPLHDVYARGTIVGLGLHHGRGHVFRAILEAVAYGFRHHTDVLHERSLGVNRILASDGGAASDVWLQITADVLRQPVHRVEGHPGSSLGAAFVAGMATGVFTRWDEIGCFVTVAPPFEPDSRAADAYDGYYSLYRETYDRLKELYPRLGAARDLADAPRSP